QKLTAALRMLAYGASAEQVDEIARMGKSTILECLVRFCDAVEKFVHEGVPSQTHAEGPAKVATKSRGS
ncbi:PREDICTED: putative nuclease HARBI1, partial [Prunus dulcis]